MNKLYEFLFIRIYYLLNLGNLDLLKLSTDELFNKNVRRNHFENTDFSEIKTFWWPKPTIPQKYNSLDGN